MSSTLTIFDAPRVFTGLTLHGFAPIAGVIAAQTVLANRALAGAALTVLPKRAAPEPATVVTLRTPQKPKAKPRKAKAKTPAKIETMVYQSKTNSGKSGAVTLAAMPMPVSKTEIQ